METEVQLNELRQELSRHLDAQRTELFGAVDPAWVEYSKEYFWDDAQQILRIHDLERYGFMPGSSKVLDMAAGCGQLMQYGAKAGYDIWGVEPERWKLDLIRNKFRLLGLIEAENKLFEGMGESLPFDDDSFDCTTTFQTLEHVQDPFKVMQEMVRVTRVGGGIYIRCPDYRSTFEAHYRLPWLPLFPHKLAGVYLKLMHRPVAGLASLQYVTVPRIMKMIRRLEESGVRLLVFNDDRIQFENKLSRRGIPSFPFAYEMWRIKRGLGRLFREEASANLFIRIEAK